MTRAILFVGAGIETVPAIQRAKELGLHVVVSDANPQAPGCHLADASLVASTYDIDASVAAAVQYNRSRTLHGVMCVATDVPLTVASIAAELGLPGITLESARLASDKLAMKRRFSTDGIPIPWFAPVESAETLKNIVRERGYPLVLKPVDSRGARGVLRLTSDVDLEWAYSKAQHYSPTQRVMIEKYMAGPQISTESLVVDGQAYTLGFSDRNYELLDTFAPHIIENGGDLPSFLPEETQRAVQALVHAAAASIGIRNGVVKGDIVVTDGEPYVIEMAARLSGGYFCSHEIPLNTGVDFVAHAIRQALGEKPDPDTLAPTQNRGVAQRYLFPKPGVVKSIEGWDEVAQRPEIAFCELRVRPGERVGPVDSHPARAGLVIATGDSREQAIEYACAAIEAIRIETVPGNE